MSAPEKKMVLVNPDQPVHFVDSINVSGKDGMVVMDFTQTLPVTSLNDRGEEFGQVKFVARVAISDPHFARFAAMCNDIVRRMAAVREGENASAPDPAQNQTGQILN